MSWLSGIQLAFHMRKFFERAQVSWRLQGTGCSFHSLAMLLRRERTSSTVMQQKIKMSKPVILLCLGYLLLVISPTAGVTMRGEQIEDDGHLETSLSRNRGARETGDSVSQRPLSCSRLYSWCWSDWDCCTTWCNGWCYCLYTYEWCYYDYECCSGWCDRYYGCLYYPYAQPQKGVYKIALSDRGRKNGIEKVE